MITNRFVQEKKKQMKQQTFCRKIWRPSVVTAEKNTKPWLWVALLNLVISCLQRSNNSHSKSIISVHSCNSESSHGTYRWSGLWHVSVPQVLHLPHERILCIMYRHVSSLPLPSSHLFRNKNIRPMNTKHREQLITASWWNGCSTQEICELAQRQVTKQGISHSWGG